MIQYNHETMITVNELRNMLKSKFVAPVIGATRLSVVEVLGDYKVFEITYIEETFEDMYGSPAMTERFWKRGKIVAASFDAYDKNCKSRTGRLGAFRQVFNMSAFI